jgi:hypothetical protein
MNEQNIISLGYDMEKLSVQQKQIVEWLTQTYETAQKIDGIKMSFGNATGMKDYTAAAKEQKTVMDEVARAEEKLTQLRTDEAKRLAELKEQIRQTTQENKLAAQVANSQADSLDQLRAKLIQAQKAYDSMSKQMREGSQEGKDAKAKVDSLTASIKGLEEGTGRFGRNVGNYSGSVKPLESLLQQLKANIDKVTQSGGANAEQIQHMQQQYAAVNAAATTASNGFVSVTQEIRQSEKALQTLRAAGLGETEQFREMQTELAKVRREFNEFAESQKIIEAEVPALAAMTTAAKGLSGVYGIGASASALFADGNEKVEKELSKLMAVMTLIQSLEEARQLIEKKSVILNQLQAFSTSVLTKAKQMLGIANVEQAATTEATTIAMEGEAIATEQAAAATVTLQGVLIASGIGAIIIALVYGVGKLVGVVSDWVNADEKAIEKQKELAALSKELNEILKAQTEIIADDAQKVVDMYQLQLDKSKAIGSTQEQQFAIERKINEAKLSQARQVVESYGATEDGVIQLSLKYSEQNEVLSRLITKEAEYISKGEKVPEKLKTKIDAQKEVTSLTKANLDEQKNAMENQDKAEKAIQVQKLAEAKFTSDQLRKIALEDVNIEQGLIQAKNAAILGNEYSTLEQRLSALKSNAKSRKEILNAELKNTLDDSTVSEKDKAEAIKKNAAEIKKINIESKQVIFKTNDDYRKRDVTAVANTNRAILDNEIKTKQEIANSDTFSLDVRLEALKQYSEDQKKNVLADAALQKSTKVMTAKELAELDSKTQIQLSTITTEGEIKRVEIIKSSFDKIKSLNAENIAAIEAFNVENQSKIAVRYSEDIQALNKQFEGKKVSLKKYARERDLIDYKYSINQAALAVNQAKDQAKVLDAFLKNGATIEELERHKADVMAQISADTSDIQRKLHEAELKRTEDELNAKRDAQKQINKLVEDGANAEKAASDAKKEHDTKLREVKLKELQDTIQKVQETANQVASIIGGILDIQFTNQKNAIQDIENAQQESYSAEIERINNSTLSEQDKADKLKILEAQRQAQKDKNAKDQKKADLEKAKFDKDIAIMNIILTTAMAVVKALPNIPLSILAGAMGAAELAVAIATPLPKYAKGTDGVVSPHFGIYGEAGPELIHKPGQSPFIADKATVDYLPIGTKITPLSNLELFAAAERTQSKNLQMAAYADTLNSRAYTEMMKAQSRAITNSIDGQTSALVRAITKSRPVVKVVNSGNYDSFINKNVR